MKSAPLAKKPESPVQQKCDSCASEPDEPVQMWSCGEYTAPTCLDEPVVQEKCESCETEPDAEADAVQHDGAQSATRSPAMVHGAARQGIAGASQPLPHGRQIQAAFGRHDVSHVRTSIGGAAEGATRSMGALAFTSGDRIGFRDAPDLRLAAHEAAHVVQQRAGLKLRDGVGRTGDRWERHADSVADAVVSGHSAEPMLDEVAQPGSAAPSAPVQRQIAPVSERLHEPPPITPELTTSAPLMEAAAPAAAEAEPEAEPGAEGAAGGAGAAAALAAAEAGMTAEAPPEGTEAAGPPPPPPGGGRGAIASSCYNVDPPPRTTDTEPTSDEPSSESEEEEAFTFEPWPDEADECMAAVALEEGAPAVAATTETLAEAAPETEGAVAEEAPPEGDGSNSESAEVQQMDSAASVTEDQSAEQGGGMEGTIASAEAGRTAAWTDHAASLGVLASVRDRVPNLEQGISFGEGGEPAAEVMRGFMARAGSQITRAVGFAESDIPMRLGGLAADTNATIGAAIEIEKQAIAARIDRAIMTAFAGADRARSRVEAEYATSVDSVHARTDAAIAILDAAHATSVEQIAEKETTGLGNVDTRFAAGRVQHEAKGPEYSLRVRDRAQAHVRGYEACKAGPGNENRAYAEDGFWDGCLTVRRAKAQQDAACTTAKGFKKGILRSANKKGYDLNELRKQYRCAVISGAGEVTTTLDTSHEQIVAGLEGSRTQALAALVMTRTQNLAAIDGALSATVRSLVAQSFSQRQAVNDSGYLKQLAVEQLAHASAAGLARGIGAAMDSLDETLAALRDQFSGSGAPDPIAIAGALASTEASLASGVDLLLSKMEEGTADAELRTVDLGTQAIEALAGITTSSNELTAEVQAGFKSQMTGITTGATTAFRELTGNHSRESTKTATDGASTMRGAVAAFDEALATIDTRIDEAIATSLGELVTQLDGELDKLDDRIISEAWKAAEAEQPAWKSVVAIILVVLVIIAAALISIATLGAGASLFAVILVGAIVGAISAGLIQIINNWAAGKDLTEGLATAMIMGAIGGAIGGGIGFGAGGLAAAAGAAGARVATQFAIQLGGDLLAEAITQTIGYVAFGQEFNWQGFLMAGAMTSVSFRPTAARPRVATPHASAPHTGGPHATPDAPTPHATPDAPTPRPSPGGSGGRRAAITQIVGGAAGGFGLEFLMSLVTGNDFDWMNAASMAAGMAVSARMSRRGGTDVAAPDAPPGPRGPGAGTAPDAPHVPGPRSALDRFRSFDPGGVSAKVEAFVERLGTRIGGGGVDPAPPVRSDIDTRRSTETGDTTPDVPDTELSQSTRRATHIGDEDHEIFFRERNGRIECDICSFACGDIKRRIDRIRDSLPDTPENATLRLELEALQARITEVENGIQDATMSHRDAITASGEIADTLARLGEAHPSLGAEINHDVFHTPLDGERPTVRTDDLGVDTEFVGRFTVGSHATDLPDNTPILYVLRDATTGAVLKVGHTYAGSGADARFGRYARAAGDLGLTLELEITRVNTTSGLNSVESTLRDRMQGAGHIMPWDNTRVVGSGGVGRIGRAGPGTPFEQLSSRARIRRLGYTWEREDETSKGYLLPPNTTVTPPTTGD